jgi:RNA-directed DNA polymerase
MAGSIGRLNANVLEHMSPHPASMAFSRGNSIRDAAAPHSGARWLIKMDIMNFFESVTERQVYRVFEDIGYEPLVAFELARLCTRLGARSTHAGQGAVAKYPISNVCSSFNSFRIIAFSKS